MVFDIIRTLTALNQQLRAGPHQAKGIPSPVSRFVAQTLDSGRVWYHMVPPEKVR